MRAEVLFYGYFYITGRNLDISHFSNLEYLSKYLLPCKDFKVVSREPMLNSSFLTGDPLYFRSERGAVHCTTTRY